MILRYKLALCLLFIVNSLLAQENIPLGVWRTHFSHSSSTTLAIREQQIFSGSQRGLFYFDKDYNSFHIQSTINGYSDISVEKLKYAQEASTLVVAYSDCNIDLLKEGKITNVKALANARINVAKRINHISINRSFAYISTTFGLVLLDLGRSEVREIYQNIGANGNMVEVYSSATIGNDLFISCSEGLKYANNISTVNLQDYNNWKTLPSTGLPSTAPYIVVGYQNSLYCGFKQEGIYKFENDSWNLAGFPLAANLRSMTQSVDFLLACQDDRILKISPSSFEEISNPSIVAPLEAEMDNDGVVWIADSVNGLLKYTSNQIEKIAPGGPATPEVQRLVYTNNKIFNLPGGFSPDGKPKNSEGGFSVFEKGLWSNYSSFQNSPYFIPPFKDPVDAEQNGGETWLASFQSGLLKINNDGNATVFDHANSSLSPDKSDPEAVRITDLQKDFEGSLWILNYNVADGAPALHERKEDETWSSYVINHPLGAFAHQLEIDYYGMKWMRIDPGINNGGILVFDEKTGRVKQLNTRPGEAGLINAQVNDMIFDDEGSLWLATNNGVSFLYQVFDVFESQIEATRPIFDNQYLLRDSKVNAIEIDGGGRKWMGTNEGGAWLFNGDATELIHHFTKENSPLPSNRILDIVVNDISGEVFFATDKGTVSFKADATSPAAELSKVKVYPNPILPDFNGLVGISGLVGNTTVKITDVSGRLIHTTRSNGGTASWNVGSRTLRTGVYYVFAVADNGEEKLVSKFAVVE